MPQIDQRPASLDIGIVPGDDFAFTIHSPIDLSGYTLAAKTGSVTLSISATPGMPAGYYYNVTITKAQSAAFAADRSWTLEWDDPNAKHRRVVAGAIRVIL